MIGYQWFDDAPEPSFRSVMLLIGKAYPFRSVAQNNPYVDEVAETWKDAKCFGRGKW